MPYNKCVVLLEMFGGWVSFLQWKSFRICRAAKFSHRTNSALRFARQTDQSAKIDQGGVETSGAAFWQQLRGAIPKSFTADGGIDWKLNVEETRK